MIDATLHDYPSHMDEEESDLRIYDIDFSGCVQYWAFARHQLDALILLKEIEGEWYAEEDEQVTITCLSKEKASACMIRTDGQYDGCSDDGTMSLWDIYLENPERAIVACSEW